MLVVWSLLEGEWQAEQHERRHTLWASEETDEVGVDLGTRT